MKTLVALILICFAVPAWAETWTGSPRIVDGDTIAIGESRLRLLSMDAFETAQNCEKDGADYACGLDARFALINLIADREVQCEGNKRDRYGRPLVVCRIGDLDLGREMVRRGWAIAAYGHEYDQDQEFAREVRAGAWSGTFQNPADWRHGRSR